LKGLELKWCELSPARQASLEEAWIACCQGSVPVGAVVVDAAGKIISRGRNRIHELEVPSGRAYGSQLAHAELNAPLALDRDLADVHSCAIYISLEPCPLCLGAIYMSGVRTIFYAAEDAYAGSANLLGTTPYLTRKPVTANGPFRNGLAEFASALHIEFCLREYRLPNLVIEMERQVFPVGVTLGEKARAGGLFQQWAAQGWTAAQAFDRIADLMPLTLS